MAYDNQLGMAYHEAGHAVVTLALGIPLVKVWLELGREKGYSEHGIDALELSVPDVHRLKATISAAGEMAQLNWNPCTQAHACDNDLDAVNSECYFLEVHMEERGDPFDRGAFKMDCRDLASRLVAHH